MSPSIGSCLIFLFLSFLVFLPFLSLAAVGLERPICPGTPAPEVSIELSNLLLSSVR
jgi:hypothetical protein